MKKWLVIITIILLIFISGAQLLLIVHMKSKLDYCLFNNKVLEDAYAAREQGIPEDETVRKLTSIGNNKAFNNAAEKAVRNVYKRTESTFDEVGLFALRSCLQVYFYGNINKEN